MLGDSLPNQYGLGFSVHTAIVTDNLAVYAVIAKLPLLAKFFTAD
jgi:hypothetical protein